MQPRVWRKLPKKVHSAFEWLRMDRAPPGWKAKKLRRMQRRIRECGERHLEEAVQIQEDHHGWQKEWHAQMQVCLDLKV